MPHICSIYAAYFSAYFAKFRIFFPHILRKISAINRYRYLVLSRLLRARELLIQRSSTDKRQLLSGCAWYSVECSYYVDQSVTSLQCWWCLPEGCSAKHQSCFHPSCTLHCNCMFIHCNQSVALLLRQEAVRCCYAAVLIGPLWVLPVRSSVSPSYASS